MEAAVAGLVDSAAASEAEGLGWVEEGSYGTAAWVEQAETPAAG